MTRLAALTFLLFSTCWLQAQVKVKGVVSNSEGNTPIRGVHILPQSGAAASVSASDGSYSMIFRKAGTYVIRYTHVSFNEVNRTIRIEPKDIDDKKELVLDVLLNEKIYQIGTVQIQAKPRPDTVHGSARYHVKDYLVLGPDSLLLLTTPKRIEKAASLRLINEKEESLAHCSLDWHTEGLLLKTPRGDSFYEKGDAPHRISFEGDSILMKEVDLESYHYYFKPQRGSFAAYNIIDDQRWYYPEFSYFAFDTVDTNFEHLHTVRDEELLDLYESEFKWLDLRSKVRVMKMAASYGMKPEELAPFYSGFVQSMYYEELYAPGFLKGDTFLVFDHYDSQLYKLSLSGEYLDTADISYHQGPVGRRWQDRVLFDTSTGDVYVLFAKNGYYYLSELDTETAAIKRSYHIQNRYPENIKVQDGEVYYLHRPFESLQKYFLYKEKILLE